MHTSAPLPFIGQKRQFIKHYRAILHQHIPDNGQGWIIVDVFGGSGLLAHVAKRCKPEARVIYNDFDGYTKRLQHIPDTNRLRQKLANVLTGVPRQKCLQPAVRAAAQGTIESFSGYVDLQALASWLLFSGQQVGTTEEFYAKSWYNTIRQSDYPEAEDYLRDLEIRYQSYEQLLPEFIDNPKALLVLDPPYVCTKQGAYRLEQYFGMVAFLRLMRFVRPPFIFFSSTRSEFMDYMRLVIDEGMEGWDKLEGHKVMSLNAQLNYQVRYEDNLVYKF